MFSWMRKNEKKSPEVVRTVTEGLKNLYKKKLLPVEEFYRFHDFHSPALEEADFENKPMVLVAGQYSTGKTTFIRASAGVRGGCVPPPRAGHAWAGGGAPPEPPFPPPRGRENGAPRKKGGGGGGMQRGVLWRGGRGVTGGKTQWGVKGGQNDNGGAAGGVTTSLPCCSGSPSAWTSSSSSSTLTSWKFRMNSQKPSEPSRANEDKIRVVLNKADMVETQQLMRVYGALMWSLGKVFNTPEVLRVFIGSSGPSRSSSPTTGASSSWEEQDLFQEIQNLPRNAALRKLNDLVKRARLVRVHAHIISRLKKEMPSVFGKDNKKKQLIAKLPLLFARIQLEQHIPPGDFPDCARMQEQLLVHDFARFPGAEAAAAGGAGRAADHRHRRPDAAAAPGGARQPGGARGAGGGLRRHPPGPLQRRRGRGRGGGRRGGRGMGGDQGQGQVRRDLLRAGAAGGEAERAAGAGLDGDQYLPSSVLGRIWQLSDVDRDGMLDAEEFALAGHLIGVKLEGRGLPADLPPRLVPPSKRRPKGSAE
ncbi:unnamed protein product [Bubo scandiacus]